MVHSKYGWMNELEALHCQRYGGSHRSLSTTLVLNTALVKFAWMSHILMLPSHARTEASRPSEEIDTLRSPS